MHPRGIKTFTRRQRPLSDPQKAVMEKAWPQFGVEIHDGLLNLKKIFNNDAPVILEIGFGHGETLLWMAQNNPDKNYLGIEVHEPGVAEVMSSVLENNIHNIRVIQNDAVKVIREHIPNDSFSHIHIYFPDPWPKKRHHKRRIINTEFVAVLIQKLQSGGVIHCATDWENYAHQMMSVLSGFPELKNCAGDFQFSDNTQLQLRVSSKFEKRGLRLGHDVWDVVFENQGERGA